MIDHPDSGDSCSDEEERSDERRFRAHAQSTDAVAAGATSTYSSPKANENAGHRDQRHRTMWAKSGRRTGRAQSKECTEDQSEEEDNAPRGIPGTTTQDATQYARDAWYLSRDEYGQEATETDQAAADQGVSNHGRRVHLR